MAEKPELHIGHLFVAGMITAAGAGLFWGIATLVRGQVNKRQPEDKTGTELDAMLIASESVAIE